MTGERNLVYVPDRSDRIHWQEPFLGAAIVVFWFYLHLSALQWLGQALQETSQFNLILLGIGGVLLVVQGIRYQKQLGFSAIPTLRPLPLALMLGSAVGAIVIRWLIQFEVLPVSLFLIGTYGLLGLFFNSSIWKRGLAFAVAIACILPFGTQFNKGLGVPVRMFTAHIVEQILHHWHIAALSSENIIVLENGIANVDLPCSGTKSLWTGSIFLFAATWLERRQVGWRWLGVCVANFALLELANIGRVLLLVILTQVWHQPTVADLLHIPLGLAGFVTACLISLALLRFIPKQSSVTVAPSAQLPALNAKFTPVVVVVCLLGLCLLPQPRSLPMQPLNLGNLQLATIQTQAIPLAPVEQNFFAEYPETTAQKYRFTAPGLSGSMLLVASPTWRSQHTPELCLVGMGFEVDHMEAAQLTTAIQGRWLSLNRSKYAAAYWFQSPKRTTGDFLTRMWGEVSRQDSTWIMASILFDQAQSSDQASVQQLLTEVHTSLDRHLHESTSGQAA
jgi:exosortase O